MYDAIREADLKDNAEIFLLGDFNMNFKDKKSPAVTELASTLNVWGLKQLITEDTRLGLYEGNIKGSCIDNIFTNSDCIAESKVLD